MGLARFSTLWLGSVLARAAEPGGLHGFYITSAGLQTPVGRMPEPATYLTLGAGLVLAALILKRAIRVKPPA